jgi:hypothetical protein
MTCKESITIDGVTYRREQANGNRAVIVVDRGWIFAGDVTEENGRIKLSRALHVFRWESIAFNGMIDDPKSSKVTLKKIADVDIPKSSEIFRVAVGEAWGL